MKKIFTFIVCIVVIFGLVGCTKKDKNNEEEPKVYTAAELKEAASKAGYITNDYIACNPGLTEDQMEGFTVDIKVSAKDYSSYCIIVATNENYAKQACDTVASEYNTCVRNGKTLFFPETDASTDVIKMLTSIVKGEPIKPVDFKTETNKDDKK